MKPETLKPSIPPEGVRVPVEERTDETPDVDEVDAKVEEPEVNVFDTLHDLDPGFHKENENESQENNEFDGTADGFHGRKIDRPPSGTFLTAVGDSDQNNVYDELGIYEDTDVGDDLSDSELELERLRAEKLQREKEEKERQIEEQRKQRELFEKQKAEREKALADPLSKYERFLKDNIDLFTPRTDISSTDSRATIKTWTDPKFLQGLSIKEILWKVDTGEIPVHSDMKTEIQQSR
ncbi:hypothetical protein ACF0H5_010395 [Mactra antiquata]